MARREIEQNVVLAKLASSTPTPDAPRPEQKAFHF
jgi:hypothetical protein